MTQTYIGKDGLEHDTVELSPEFKMAMRKILRKFANYTDLSATALEMHEKYLLDCEGVEWTPVGALNYGKCLLKVNPDNEFITLDDYDKYEKENGSAYSFVVPRAVCVNGFFHDVVEETTEYKEAMNMIAFELNKLGFTDTYSYDLKKKEMLKAVGIEWDTFYELNGVVHQLTDPREPAWEC